METEAHGGSPELKTPELGFRELGSGGEGMVGKCWHEGNMVVWVDQNRVKKGAEIKAPPLTKYQEFDQADEMESIVRILRDAGYTWTKAPDDGMDIKMAA